ncbi:hypothetical protein HanRHA438_Chr12g0568241 [Helianthus annuus]|nr:hypothetical protein HanRHA438_Chr12g0568241 [Helianthus annuus]
MSSDSPFRYAGIAVWHIEITKTSGIGTWHSIKFKIKTWLHLHILNPEVNFLNLTI